MLLAALAAILLASAAASARPVAWGLNTQVSLLPADEAFQLLPVERRGKTLHVEWNVAPGYYLYRDRLAFELVGAGGARLGKVMLPRGERVTDEHFGEVEVYRGIVAADLAVSGGLPAGVRVRLAFQGCADAGVCYPPQQRTVAVEPARP
jgi:thiol:disulfide interchange protein